METLYSVYQADSALESEIGIELNFGPAQFIVKRAGGSNKQYQSVLRTLSTPYRRQIQNETIDPDKLNQMFMRVYARSVVLGWKNVTDREGNELPFSEANFIKIMTDLPDLWRQLQEECDRLTNFRIAANAEDGEALGNSSSGILPGVQH